MTPIQVALGVSEGKLKPIYPTDVHPKLNVLLESVLSLDQRDRPTFDVIVEELSMILEELKANVRSMCFENWLQLDYCRRNPKDLFEDCCVCSHKQSFCRDICIFVLGTTSIDSYECSICL